MGWAGLVLFCLGGVAGGGECICEIVYIIPYGLDGLLYYTYCFWRIINYLYATGSKERHAGHAR